MIRHFSFVNWRRLFSALLSLLALTIVAGCSSSRSSSPIALLARSSPGSYRVESQHGSDALLFHADESELSGYVTALKSCGYREKASLRGTVRQIFVGLEKLKIKKQEYVEIAGRRLYVVDADAESEGLPIRLTTYSYKAEGCFIDYVLWVAPPKQILNESPEASAAYDTQLERLRTHFGSYVGEAMAS